MKEMDANILVIMVVLPGMFVLWHFWHYYFLPWPRSLQNNSAY